MVVSFVSNNAALSAQGNIGYANDSAAASIARLSSGNRINKASDDVAGLSVGTILATGVTTLKQALANAGQGTSLLQVADGALQQIGTILSRQKAIATQANSGTLSDTDRSYLNQEFQALTSQIDQIAGATTFSSVKLLDGTLSGATGMGLNTNLTVNLVAGAVTAANQTTASSSTIFTIANTNVAAGDTFTINGYTATFTTAGTFGQSSAAGKVVLGATAQQTAQNVAAFLNTVDDARISNFNFTTTGTGAVVAVYNGGEIEATPAQSVKFTTSYSIATAGAITGGGSLTIAGSANTINGLAIAKVVSLGASTGTILQNSGNTPAATGTNLGQGINTVNVVDNASFYGKLGQGDLGYFTGVFNSNAANTAIFSLKVGNITYTSASTALANAAAGTSVTFTGRDSNNNLVGGTFLVNFANTAGNTLFNSQSQLDGFMKQMNDGLAGITFTQNRDVTTVVPGNIVNVNGVQVGNLSGITANWRSDDFTYEPQIQSIKITAPGGGTSDAKFSVVINGETYESYSGLGNQIGVGALIAMRNISDPTKAFTIVMGSTGLTGATSTTLDLGTQAKADAITAAFMESFGIDGSKAALNLQVGAATTDSIGVQLNSVSSTNLFHGAVLDVTTIDGARAAGTAVDTAIQTVTAARATVGALQSRLNFTSANLQTSISNQDAARSVLLDTDVSSESTKYATAQVQLQAGIAVLAQANQITQNLLKLIQ